MTAPSSPKKPFALIIEDHPDTADIFALALQLAGFEVEIVKDGQVAQDRLANTIPAVVTLDLHLPFVTGDDLLRQIRADDRLAKTRVMITTADPIRAEYLRSMADLVLLKPIDFGQIRELASRLLPPDGTNQ